MFSRSVQSLLGLGYVASFSQAAQSEGAPSSGSYPRIIFTNRCDEHMTVRGLVHPGNAACNLSKSEDPHGKNCQNFAPGEKKVFDFDGHALGGKSFFMSYANQLEATIGGCNGLIFCQAVQVSANHRGHLNFANEYAYSFPVSIEFRHGAGLSRNCPLDGPGTGVAPEYCTDPKSGIKCKSRRGHPETCNFDFGHSCPDNAWKLTFDPSTNKSWCVTPDSHMAVISANMGNPTTEVCAQDPRHLYWRCHAKECDHRMCSWQWNIALYLSDGFHYLYAADHSAPGGWKKLTPRGLDKTADKRELKESIEYVKHRHSQGGKHYQHRVNYYCGQQATDQVRGTWPHLELVEPNELHHRTRRDGLKSYACASEGEDSQEYWPNSRVMGITHVMTAGDVGIFCNPGEFDAVEITMCAKHLPLEDLPDVEKKMEIV